MLNHFLIATFSLKNKISWIRYHMTRQSLLAFQDLYMLVSPSKIGITGKQERRKATVRQQSSELANTLLADAAMIEVDNV